MTFCWEDFWSDFPFGDLSIRQGDYQAAFSLALDALSDDQKGVLLAEAR
jgi:hypothetical protein